MSSNTETMSLSLSSDEQTQLKEAFENAKNIRTLSQYIVSGTD